jgi:hypothetical protein
MVELRARKRSSWDPALFCPSSDDYFGAALPAPIGPSADEKGKGSLAVFPHEQQAGREAG